MTKEHAEAIAKEYNEKNKPVRRLRAYVDQKTLQPKTKYNEEITSYEVIYPIPPKSRELKFNGNADPIQVEKEEYMNRQKKKIKSKHARGKRMLTRKDLLK